MTILRPISTASSTEDERAALAAAIADPLWLLARQWQTGGLMADDAGTPVHVELAHATMTIQLDGTPLAAPVAAMIEAERPPSAYAMAICERTRLAAELMRRLRDAGLADAPIAALRAALSHAYPLPHSTVGASQAPFAGRLPDAAALFTALAAVLAPDGSGGPFPALSGVDPADAPTAQAAEAAVRAWFAWAHPQLGPAAGLGTPEDADIAPAAWDPERLDYRFALTADLPDGTVTLRADGYDGTGIDWHSFDRSTLAPLGNAAAAATIEVRPSPVRYAGMPRPRFWELEDGNVNLDLMAGRDPAHALLAMFAHAYANDWFVVPLDVAPGASLIERLTITDTFGTTTDIAPTAALDGPGARWSLWELSTTPLPAVAPNEGDAAAGLRIHLPIAGSILDGSLLEDVLIARDEMANLAWLIELTTLDRDGSPVDRFRRWLQLRVADDPTFNPAAHQGAAGYRLGPTLPDNWYPLVGDRSTTAAPRLLLAQLPPGATDVSDEGVQGRLIPHHVGTVVADEEASRSGSRVRRLDRLMRTSSARHVWRARVKQPGTAEASSGLRFDVLR